MVLKSFDQGSALFILVEAPPFDLLEIKILFKNNHLPKIGAVPSSLSLSSGWRHQTKPQDSGGATPSCIFPVATSMLFLAQFNKLQFDMDTLPHTKGKLV